MHANVIAVSAPELRYLSLYLVSNWCIEGRLNALQVGYRTLGMPNNATAVSSPELCLSKQQVY